MVEVHVHPARRLVEQLDAVEADVAAAGARVAGIDVGKCDVAPAVLGPALERGNREKVRRFGLHHLLAGSGADRLGGERGHPRQLGEHLHLLDDALGGLDLEKLGDLIGHGVQALDAERPHDSRIGCVGVDQDGDVVALPPRTDGGLEKERRAARLHAAIGDLGDLELDVHRRGDAAQLAGGFEIGDKFSE